MFEKRELAVDQHLLFPHNVFYRRHHKTDDCMVQGYCYAKEGNA